MDSWDASMILWAFSKFEGYPVGKLFEGIEAEIVELVPEMTPQELSLSLKAYSESFMGKQNLYEVFVEKTKEVLESL